MGKMNNQFTTLFFLMFLVACGTNFRKKTARHHFLIFIDKSQSVNSDPGKLSALVEAQLGPFLKKMVCDKGDRIEAHLVHGASVGNPAVVREEWMGEEPTEDGKGPNTYKDELADYETSLVKFRMGIQREVLAYIEQVATGDVTMETDLLGTVQVISEYLQSAAPGDSTVVWYISDMVHSQKEPRDYQVHPLKDRQEAEVCAAKDYDWLQLHLKINSKAFEQLKVHIIFPNGNYEKNQNAEMMYYWSALFHKINLNIQLSQN